jgi:thymidine phosphorylase
MVETAKRMGVRATALITDMDQPLGSHVGNTLEVEEALAVLRGGGADDLRALCLELAAWMFCLGGRAPTVQRGKQLAEDLLGSGAALDKFRQMIELQDGDPSIVDDPKRLPQSHSALDIKASQDGFVVSIDCRHMGIACLALGGGREHTGDSIDHAVGFILHKKVGDAVAAGEVLCTVYYNSESRLHRARKIVEESYRILPDAPAKHRPLVRGVIRDVQFR